VSPRGRSATGQVAAAALAALILSMPLPAESLYVIEQLVVAVSSAPDASGEHVATLHSGDRVEVLERAGEHVHVRLASGREGWVRSSYLSADEPLRVRLAQRDAEVARLNDELSALKTQLRGSGTATSSTAVVDASAAAGAAPAPQAAEEPGSAPAPTLFGASEDHPRMLWPWTLATGLVGFGIGFGLGALMLDRHIRRKYGGLRIY
jgi:SH3-like domain-containing protein